MGLELELEYIGVYIGPLRPCQVCLITSHYIYIYIYIYTHTHILVHLAIYCTSCLQRVHHDDVTNRYQNYLKCAQLYNRVSFQISLKINSSNFNFIYIYIYIYIFNVNFKNLIVKFYVSYVLNIHIKFCLNRILFIIQLINLFFIHNFRSQELEILYFLIIDL